MQVFQQLFQTTPPIFKIVLEYFPNSTKIWALAIKTHDIRLVNFCLKSNIFKVSYFADLIHRQAFRSTVGLEYFSKLLIQHDIQIDYESMLRGAIAEQCDDGFMRIANRFENEIVHEIKNVNHDMLLYALKDVTKANVTNAIMFLIDKCGIDIESHDSIVISQALDRKNQTLFDFIKKKGIDLSKKSNKTAYMWSSNIYRHGLQTLLVWTRALYTDT